MVLHRPEASNQSPSYIVLVLYNTLWGDFGRVAGYITSHGMYTIPYDMQICRVFNLVHGTPTTLTSFPLTRSAMTRKNGRGMHSRCQRGYWTGARNRELYFVFLENVQGPAGFLRLNAARLLSTCIAAALQASDFFSTSEESSQRCVHELKCLLV
ncbi:hypothetical protein BDU57DRAFT_153314 [Ampelomyces quisqualis]|uniref:Uncharacterized protein n=1 Tax=Ampelomyces quisqualis TaxID=50730 RepID=A0A6A5QWJ7_AMPQU|nr:hypothetical protein BDU57DRAFT_153314 [Ampelomyces quisqualis]